MKIVLGITGASGSIYGIRMLEVLHELGVSVSLIITDLGKRVAEYETGINIVAHAKSLGITLYNIKDMFAAPASGSHLNDGLLVLPCSMGSLSRFAHGISSNLLERAFDVALKEGRRIILCPRETPLSMIHIKNMLSLSEAGVLIAPLSVAFYAKPKSLDDIINFHIGKILNTLGIKHELLKEWPYME